MIGSPAHSLSAEQAFVRLVQQHQKMVWRYLRYLGCEATQAEDLVQETFLRAWRSGFEERAPAATAAWLRTVARNLLIDRGRRARIRPVLRDLEEADHEWAQYDGDHDARGYREALRACLDRLGSRARLALSLFYAQGQSPEAIAETMSIRAGGVKTLLHRTREALRSCIEGRLGS